MHPGHSDQFHDQTCCHIRALDQVRNAIDGIANVVPHTLSLTATSHRLLASSIGATLHCQPARLPAQRWMQWYDTVSDIASIACKFCWHSQRHDARKRHRATLPAKSTAAAAVEVAIAISERYRAPPSWYSIGSMGHRIDNACQCPLSSHGSRGRKFQCQ